MTIRHLEIFITVADCGKMSKAAEYLYITQPTVSQAVRELEDYYGARLFERFSRKLFITEEGKNLLSYARHIVDSFRDMERSMKDMGKSGRLRVGASVSVGTCLLGEWLKLFEEKVPGAETLITVCNTSQVEEMVLKSGLDLGIVEGMVESENLVRIPVCEDKLVMVVGKGHPLYGKKQTDISCLYGADYISRESGSAEKNQLEQMLMKEQLHLNKVWSSTNTEAIKNAVTEGRGFAILSDRMVEKEVAEGDMQIILENKSMRRKIQLIHHKDKFIPETMRKFIAICRNPEQVRRNVF